MQDPFDDFLECVEGLKQELSFHASQGEGWVLGLAPSEELVSAKTTQETPKKNPPAAVSSLNRGMTAAPLSVSVEVPRKTETPKRSVSPFLSSTPQTESPIVFLRLCPSVSEQTSGKPYSDEAAGMLDKIVLAMSWKPETIHKTYLCSSSSDFASEEALAECVKKLQERLLSVRPKVLIAWGERVSQVLVGSKKNIEELHEHFVSHPQGFVIMPSWDPAYLIRRPEFKKPVWNDLKKIDRHLR